MAIFLFSLTFGLTSSTLATHDPALSWMNKYKNEQGYGCCGVRDCIPVKAHVIEQGPGYVVVDVNGVEMRLPQSGKPYWGKTHFISDDVDYWCFEFDYEGTEPSDTGIGDGTFLWPEPRIRPAAFKPHRPIPEISLENTRCVFISFGG